MRRNRIAALVLFVLSLISISFKGGPVSYGFFFFTLFVPLVSFAYTLVVYLRFKIYQEIGTRPSLLAILLPFIFLCKMKITSLTPGLRPVFSATFLI